MLWTGPEIYTLASGSSGNCVFVRSGAASLLVDAGISMRSIDKALCTLGGALAGIDALLVTHEHSDHIKALPMIASHYGIPIYMPAGCLHGLPVDMDRSNVRPMPNDGFSLEVGDIKVTAFPTPHDSIASVGYVFDICGRRFGLATDMGMPTKNVAEALCGCESVIIEANYEKTMLENGPYPDYLKRRIASNRGHLENTDCAKMIAYLALEGKTDSFMLAHLSDKNNTPQQALDTVRGYLSDKNISVNISVASRYGVTRLVG